MSESLGQCVEENQEGIKPVEIDPVPGLSKEYEGGDPGGVKAAGPSLRGALMEGPVTRALPYGKPGRGTVFFIL